MSLGKTVSVAAQDSVPCDFFSNGVVRLEGAHEQSSRFRDEAPRSEGRDGRAKKNGSAQTRKTYRNAGIRSEMFGVSYAFLKKLHKRVGTDHEVALALWDTGILDARLFACWVADAEKTTIKLLETWARDESEPALAGELAAFAQDTDLAAGRMRKWIGMKSAYRTTLGWSIAGRLVMQPGRGPDQGGVTEDDVADLLERIENGLQNVPDKTRYVMNSGVACPTADAVGTTTAIGCRPGWMKKAIAVARKVGKVDVDFGNRSCKVKDAASTIKQTVEHYKKQGKGPTDGTGGQRRRHC
jgi:hypothetical protein